MNNFHFDELFPKKHQPSEKTEINQNQPWNVETSETKRINNELTEEQPISQKEETKISLNDLLKDHHQKMTPIFSNQIIEVKANQGDIQYFYFDVDHPSVITVKAWPANEESDPDLYMSNGTPFVSQASYMWKSANIGHDRIDIQPQDSKFKLGRYYIGAMPYRNGLNTFFVSLTLTDAKEIVKLEDGDFYQLELRDSLFFEYKIKHLGNSYIFISLNQREKLQMYISTMSLYPCEKEHKWAFGELPDTVLEKSKNNPFMRDIYTEASPFVIEGQKIAYYKYFKNPNSYKVVENQDQIGYIPSTLAQELNSSTSANQIINKNSTKSFPESLRDETKDLSSYVENNQMMSVLLESEAWRFITDKVRIGIYNSAVPIEESRYISLKVEEIEEKNLLPDDLKKKLDIFEQVFSEKDASFASQKERTIRNVCDRIEFTYGEVLFVSFIPLIGLCQPKEGDIFWDLGCGGGRPLAIASLVFPQLSKCIGVELLDGLYDLAKQMSEELPQLAQQIDPDERVAPIEVIKGDILEIDWWSSADIIYTSSICFPDELVDGIADRCEKLKKGARVISLKTFPERPYLTMEYSLKIKMTWGNCQVVVYSKNSDPLSEF